MASKIKNGDDRAAATDFDVVVVGAGFAGMYTLHRLREMGLSVRVVEAGSDVGGTWYWNRYPGARCDVESMQYSYQFSEALQQEWEWSERYATQPEILRYVDHVAKRFDLRRDIQFNTRVTAATFDDQSRRWHIDTDDGTRLSAPYCIMATGCLSAANKPQFKGQEDFAGQVYHTGHWPPEGVDFTGQRVAVIGTGSSAIQSIPVIAEQAAQLIVFQRTPNYAVPAHNAPLDPTVVSEIKADYAGFRAKAKLTPTGNLFKAGGPSALAVSAQEREREYEARWQAGGLPFLAAYADLMFDADANKTVADFVRNKIRAIVRDTAVADLLVPRNIIGCKRLCIDTGYYDTFNRDNVSLVDISDTPVEAITENGVSIDGRVYEVDAIVSATGFDAMTGALLKIDIRGSGGVALRDKWRDGPRAYLGLALAGFPNLFMITGPGSPSVISNMLPAIEQHVNWITECIGYMRANGLGRIEAQGFAEDAWVAHVGEVADMSLRSTCSSWYVGANVPGKPRVYMPYIGGVPAYAQKCEEVASAGYDGFVLS
ncbi:MAG: cation diffusion facilitator CzcD-associated flavoprotein CzcO [Alphaproteobacteria bacterium]|jgi:cation diffusion facilitator CzcD-associated flavoprotein CzcO